MTELYLRTGERFDPDATISIAGAKQKRFLSAPTAKANGAAEVLAVRSCSRCGGGGGSGRWAHTGWTCHMCGGSGKTGIVPVKLYTAERLARLEEQAEKRNAKASAERERKAAEEAARRAAEAEQNLAASLEQYPDEMAFIQQVDLAELPFGEDFIKELREKTAAGHLLTEAQAKSVQRIQSVIDWEAFTQSLIDNGEDIAAGRQELVGYILKLEWRPAFGGGYQTKMLFIDERGFKLWGNVPKGVCEHLKRDSDGDLVLESGKRMQIAFTATLEAKESRFGFFKRPSAATLLALPPDRQQDADNQPGADDRHERQEDPGCSM